MAHKGDNRIHTLTDERLEVEAVGNNGPPRVVVEFWPADSRQRRPGTGTTLTVLTPEAAEELARRLVAHANMARNVAALMQAIDHGTSPADDGLTPEQRERLAEQQAYVARNEGQA